MICKYDTQASTTKAVNQLMWHLTDSPALLLLLVGCIWKLELAMHPPQPPSNWRLETRPISCSCGDCKEFMAFLQSPTQQVKEFAMALRRRTHIERCWPCPTNHCYMSTQEHTSGTFLSYACLETSCEQSAIPSQSGAEIEGCLSMVDSIGFQGVFKQGHMVTLQMLV